MLVSHAIGGTRACHLIYHGVFEQGVFNSYLKFAICIKYSLNLNRYLNQIFVSLPMCSFVNGDIDHSISSLDQLTAFFDSGSFGPFPLFFNSSYANDLPYVNHAPNIETVMPIRTRDDTQLLPLKYLVRNFTCPNSFQSHEITTLAP
jgi:hypothetical protein